MTAFVTLWECLTTVSLLSAPFTPFVSDEIYTNVTRGSDTDSIHLVDWPEPDESRRDDALRSRMETVRRLVAIGRSARTVAKVRTRQPLARALLVMPAAEAAALGDLKSVVAEELNVKDVEIAQGLDDLISYTVKPNFKALGPRFGARVKEAAAALAAGNAAAIVRSLEDTGIVEIEVDGKMESFEAGDLDVRVEGRSGFSLAQDGPYGVALDLEVTAELAAEGYAREVVRAVNELRKSSGLAVDDRIELWLTGPGKIIDALRAHADFVAGEVLAVALVFEDPVADTFAETVNVEDEPIAIALRRVSEQ